MLAPNAILAGIALPAGLSGLLYGAGWRLWRRRPAGAAAWVPPVALGVGFIAGFIALEGWPGLLPLEVAGWLPWLGLGALLAGVGRVVRLPAAPVLRLAVAVAIPLLTLRPFIEHRWDGLAATLWVTGLAAGLFMLGWGLDQLAARCPGVRVPLALWTTVTAAAVCIAIAGSARLFQLTAILSAALAAALVASLLRGNASQDGGSTVAFSLFGALLINGFFYLDDLPVAAALLLAAAPLGAWTARRGNGSARAALAAAAVLVPLATAVALTVAAMPDDPYGY